ncbi:MAG: hypothetical protein QOI73_3492 [Solirubrobacteraceae bacterium]|nr:hypothetical protein [Solirubrobacteraceae bacterium]
MGRLTTTLTSAAAAGLTALVVTVAAPASGGDTPPDKGAGTVEHREGNTTPQELQDCLRSHGAAGVPGEQREGRALKEWIVTHQDDEAVRAALKACDVYFGDQKPAQVGQVGKSDCSAVAGEKSKAVDAAKQKGRATTVRTRPAV